MDRSRSCSALLCSESKSTGVDVDVDSEDEAVFLSKSAADGRGGSYALVLADEAEAMCPLDA